MDAADDSVEPARGAATVSNAVSRDTELDLEAIAQHLPVRAATADMTLADTLARCADAAELRSPSVLATVAALARRAAARGVPPLQIATTVRRSLAAAAHIHMTAVVFESTAHHLARHALEALIAD